MNTVTKVWTYSEQITQNMLTWTNGTVEWFFSCLCHSFMVSLNQTEAVLSESHWLQHLLLLLQQLWLILSLYGNPSSQLCSSPKATSCLCLCQTTQTYDLPQHFTFPFSPSWSCWWKKVTIINDFLILILLENIHTRVIDIIWEFCIL